MRVDNSLLAGLASGVQCTIVLGVSSLPVPDGRKVKQPKHVVQSVLQGVAFVSVGEWRGQLHGAHACVHVRSTCILDGLSMSSPLLSDAMVNVGAHLSILALPHYNAW